MTRRRSLGEGLLILGGGRDEPDGSAVRRIADETRARRGKLVICAASSSEPEEAARRHERMFRDAGLEQIEILDLEIREDAMSDTSVRALDGAVAVFLTGGDQLRLTATIGDTPVFQRMRELYASGGIIAGTSSGCAAIPETMLIGGPGGAALKADEIAMAPGLGLMSGVILDSHFAERGRIGRLILAVSQNPKNLGIGVDEDTAIVVRGRELEAIGSGSVYVVDGSAIRYSSLSGQPRGGGVVSTFGVTVHVLADGDRFDLEARTPEVEAVPERQASG